jgi:hypothetical protein
MAASTSGVPAGKVAVMNLTYLAIDPHRLDTMRHRGADEFGHPWKPRTAQGWEALRCCLRTAESGEDIALISYSPWPLPWNSTWSEAGPVFVCFHRCPGYPDAGRYPQALQRQHALLNPFDHQGARAYRHIRFVEPDQDHDAAVRTVLGQPDVAFLHVRSAVAQCFTFEVRGIRSPT